MHKGSSSSIHLTQHVIVKNVPLPKSGSTTNTAQMFIRFLSGGLIIKIAAILNEVWPRELSILCFRMHHMPATNSFGPKSKTCAMLKKFEPQA